MYKNCVAILIAIIVISLNTDVKYIECSEGKNIKQLYQEILSNYSEAIGSDLSEKEMAVMGVNYTADLLSEDTVGYCIMDINSDGIQELIIGPVNDDEDKKGMFYDLLSFYDGKLIHLQKSWNRGNAYLTSGKQILTQWRDNDGEFYSISNLVEDASELELVKELKITDEGKLLLSTVENGNLYVDTVEDGDFGLAKFWKMAEKEAIQYIPFSELDLTLPELNENTNDDKNAHEIIELDSKDENRIKWKDSAIDVISVKGYLTEEGNSIDLFIDINGQGSYINIPADYSSDIYKIYAADLNDVDGYKNLIMVLSEEDGRYRSSIIAIDNDKADFVMSGSGFFDLDNWDGDGIYYFNDYLWFGMKPLGNLTIHNGYYTNGTEYEEIDSSVGQMKKKSDSYYMEDLEYIDGYSFNTLRSVVVYSDQDCTEDTDVIPQDKTVYIKKYINGSAPNWQSALLISSDGKEGWIPNTGLRDIAEGYRSAG